MKKFNIPEFYRSPIITSIKQFRRTQDTRKRELHPTVFSVGDVEFKIARHFGFCYGVENAIEIAFRAIDENPGKRIFLLSEMIHNQQVNADLQKRGVMFLMSTDGTPQMAFSDLTPDDVVIVPAFGTTVEMFAALEARGINPQTYNATCPFVEKVWNRSQQLGTSGYTIIIHGKHYHEETRATFSHAKVSSASVIIRNMEEARLLSEFFFLDPDDHEKIKRFYDIFADRHSENFDPVKDLRRIGVVNQTTMLAGDTVNITNFFKQEIARHVGDEKLSEYIADTKDTLCYATSENQSAIQTLVASGGDVAIVIGGYNSSNTTHLAKLCEQSLPTYTVKDASEIHSSESITYLDLNSLSPITATNWLPSRRPLRVLISAGASSPDALVDQVIERVCEILGVTDKLAAAVSVFQRGSEVLGIIHAST